jgi:hypothetical protein
MQNHIKKLKRKSVLGSWSCKELHHLFGAGAAYPLTPDFKNKQIITIALSATDYCINSFLTF